MRAARRLTWLLALCLFGLALPLSAQESAPAAAPTAAPEYRPDRLLIGLQPGVTPEAAAAALGLTLRRAWPALGIAELSVPSPSGVTAQAADAVLAVQAAAAASPLVRYASLDYAVHVAQAPVNSLAASPPNDPLADDQWALPIVRAAASWDITQGDGRTAVAVLDTGYDPDHADLPAGQLWRNQAEVDGVTGADDDGNGYVDDLHGWDWVEDDNDPADLYGHGTHVFGVIAAATNNGLGIAALGPKLHVAPLRVLDEFGSGWLGDLVAGLDYARAMDIRIANLSLTVSFDSPALQDAVVAAHAAGMLVFAASGNTSASVLWPARYPETVAVAATTRSDERADYSNRGEQVDIAAPGSGILSTYLGNTYREQSGTSMATPHVAALAGLVWSLRPDFDAAQVLNVIQATAVDVNAAGAPGPDDALGAGRIDMAAALARASEGLVLTAEQGTDLFALAGTEVVVPMRVTTPGGSGVGGAVVSYQLLRSADDQAVGIDGRVTADGSGRSRLVFSAPSVSGTYRLLAQTGRASADVVLAVHTTQVSVTLTLSPTVLTAGGDPASFRVELRRPSGDLETSALPVQVETTLGLINGRARSQLITVNGVYTGTLAPETQAGTAQLSARIGPIADQATVEIRPGPPASIVGPTEAWLVTSVAANSVPLTFEIQDKYGNSVADGTAVRFQSVDGGLDPAQTTTAGGRAATTLTLPSGGPFNTVRVRVILPGLQSVVNVPLRIRYWFPSIWE